MNNITNLVLLNMSNFGFPVRDGNNFAKGGGNGNIFKTQYKMLREGRSWSMTSRSRDWDIFHRIVRRL